MSLSLKITSYQRLTPGQQAVYRADSDTFTIGRSSENDWTIPDPQRFLSGVHCRIHKEGDTYYITDTSTNGVFMNGSEQRLTRNDSVVLRPDDKFRIGDYEFEVSIEDASLVGNPLTSNDETMLDADPFDDPFATAGQPQEPDLAAEPDPFSDEDPFSEPQAADTPMAADAGFQKELNTPLAQLDDSGLGKPVRIDSLMDFDDDEPDLNELESADKLAQQSSPLRESFTPTDPEPAPPVGTADQANALDEIPDNWDEATGMLRIPAHNDPGAKPAATEIPDDWDATTGSLKAPPPPAAPGPEASDTPAPKPKKEAQPRPQAPAAPPTAAHSGAATAAFAHGAGLNPEDLAGIDQAVLFEQVGRMLVMFTEGLIQTLGGRTHIKSEFRLDQTMIRPAENNPFKFSTSKTRTLLQLLSKNDPAYMTGVHAIREGFDDVNAHQMAVIAGMEAALQDILGRFNPKTLETRMVSDSVLDTILPGGKKAKYWDIFKILFEEIAGEAEDNFQQLFGREFSRAYEEQLARLKNTHKE